MTGGDLEWGQRRMTAAFPTILAVLIGLTFEEFYAESAMPSVSAWRLLLALPVCLLPVAMGEGLLFAASRRFEQGKPFEHSRYVKWIAQAPLPLYAVILFGCGWPNVLVPMALERAFLIDHLVILLPYLVLFLGATVESLRMRQPLRVTPQGVRPARFADVRARTMETLRQLVLILAPLFGLLLALDLVSDTGLRLYFENLPLLSTAFLLGVFLVMAGGFPWVVRYSLKARPLIQGAPLRRHLERQSARLDFSCRDILMWTTKRPVLNAAIVGVLPKLRYVILTAELCRQLTLDELGAVFAHEVGHGKRNHALYYTLFSLAFFTLLVPVAAGVGNLIEVGTEGAIEASLAGAAVVFLPAFAVYWLFLFSYLSRRFEMEADIYGAESSQDPAVFIETLEKVARVARIRRRAKASRHFSIAGRSDFLRKAYLEGDNAPLIAFKDRMRKTRRAMIVGSAVVLVCAFVWLSFESLRGVGVILLEAGRKEQARSVLSQVVEIRDSDTVALTLLAEIEIYRETSPDEDTGPSWSQVVSRAPSLLREQRTAVLDALRIGWSRVLADPRADLAGVILDRIVRVNTIGGPDGDRRTHDEGLARDLDAMRQVTDAVARMDKALVQEVLDRDPRWLRRPDARQVRSYLGSFTQAP